MLQITLKNIFILIVIFILNGCGGGGSGSYTPANDDSNNNANATTITAVDGYINNATIKDSLGQIATFSQNGKYIFLSSPTYPLYLSGGILADTNATFDINMSVTNSQSNIISPITTFLGNDSELLSKFSNLGLNKSTLSDFSIDYIDSNDTELTKLSQLLYVVLKDTSLTSTFKNSIKNNNTLDNMTKLFNVAKTDINNSAILSDESKYYSNQLLTKVEEINSSISNVEGYLKEYKQNIIYTTEQFKPFITTWETNSTDSNITIPTLVHIVKYKYNYTVDWGDGVVEYGKNNNATHTYTTDGNHTVKIYGIFPAIYFNNDGFGYSLDTGINSKQLLQVLQWGDIQWNTMEMAYAGCSKLTIKSSDNPNLINVEKLNGMFFEASKLNTNFSDWNVSNIRDMSSMFYGASLFNQPLSGWNVSNVRDMSGMFFRATSFNQNISNWDVSNVTDMSSMFVNTVFNQPINNWNVSNVTNMNAMFSYIYDKSYFNQSLSNWDTSKVTNMGSMFSGTLYFNQNIDNWNTGNVTNMGSMFYDASSFTNHNLSSWDVHNISNHTYFGTDWGTGNTEPSW